MERECPICVSKLTPARTFTCDRCDYTTCKACVARYLTQTIDDPHCMQCRTVFDRDKLKTISSSFVNGPLKRHREHVLLDREMAKLPATQRYVDRELRQRENNRAATALAHERERLLRRLHEIRERMLELGQRVALPDAKREFTHRCSVPNCRGFLSSAWKCGVCGTHTCNTCNTPRRDGHVCAADDVQTFATVQADATKCPGCAQYISRVSGCDQMWCIGCHTAFSWQTGRKVNGALHNPHYYDFMRTRGDGAIGRELGDVPCGGLPSVAELRAYVRGADRAANECMRCLYGYHRLTVHVTNDDLLRVNALAADTEERNVDLRVKYMLGELDDEAFRVQLQRREKRVEKAREIQFILQMFVHTSSDMLRRFCTERTDQATALRELRALHDYTNVTLGAVSQRFGCVVPQLDPAGLRTTWMRPAAPLAAAP